MTTDWQKRDSGLIVPVEVRSSSPRMTREEYLAAHEACPKCFGESIEQTCVGYMPCSGDYCEPFKDTNRATCCCGCGWKGVVHDLVPKKVESCEL